MYQRFRSFHEIIFQQIPERMVNGCATETWKSQSVKIIQRKIIPIIEFSEVEGNKIGRQRKCIRFFLRFPCLCFVQKTAKIFYFVPGGFSSSQVCTFESIWSIWPSSHPHIMRSSSKDDFVCNKNIFASRRIAEIIYDKLQRKVNRRWRERRWSDVQISSS